MKKSIQIGVASFLALAVLATVIFSVFFLITDSISRFSNPFEQQDVITTEDSCSNFAEVEYSSDGTTFTQSSTIRLSLDEAEPFPDPTMDIYEEARKVHEKSMEQHDESEVLFNVSDEYIFNETNWYDSDTFFSQSVDLLTMSDDPEFVDWYGYLEEMESRCKSSEQQ